MSDDPLRTQLALEQATLVNALLCGGATPPGCDGARIALAGASLRRKRVGGIRRSWPSTVASLGPRADALLTAYVTVYPSAHPAGPLADGAAFVAWLAARGEATDASVIEEVRVRLGVRFEGGAIRRRRGLRIAFARRPNGRPLMAIGWPWGRCRIVG